MSKKKRPVNFEIPRDEDGQFLPKELWTKKEIREHDRLKEQGLLKNPMKKVKVAGAKKEKELYVHPRGDKGTFIPKEEWTASEKRLAKKAEEKGLTIAAQLPRDEKGRFVSPTGKKSKKKKKTQPGELVPSVDYPVVSSIPSGDGRGIHQGNVTVVYPPYPPYPPHPAPVATQVSPPTPTYIPFQVVQPAPVRVPPLRIEAAEVPMIAARAEKAEEDEAVMLPTGAPDQPYIYYQKGVLYEYEPKTGTITKLQDIDEIREEIEQFTGKYLTPEETLDYLVKRRAEIQDKISRGDIKENPRSLYPMYYVKPTFSERIGDTFSNLARNPLLALVAIGAIAAIGYALYRAIKAFRFRTLNSVGVDIVGGTIYFPGEEPYTITDEDKLWLARSIWGEVNRDPAAWPRSDVQQGGAAVLWAFANHYITVGAKRNLYPTLGDFVQAYSQPINPRWDEASDSRCQANPEMCTPDRLAFRNALRNKPWTEFPPALQNLVLSFATGQVPNPIGTRTDFRAAGTGYTPADPINVAGNVFGTAANARRRPVEQVA